MPITLLPLFINFGLNLFQQDDKQVSISRNLSFIKKAALEVSGAAFSLFIHLSDFLR